MGGPVVDSQIAQEFMREALSKIAPEELEAIAAELEAKSDGFRSFLADGRSSAITSDQLRAILRSVFSSRRRAGDLRPEALRGEIHTLLHGGGSIACRFQAFCDRLDGLPDNVRYDLASELLHFAYPNDYWLWTRWIWDPRTRTGALPLVTRGEHALTAGSLGELYLKVGEALAFVHQTGQAAGFTRIGQGPFGVDVYLACVYCVYVYTTLRLRMTQEFNQVIPKLPELCRRFLGVYRMEV
ncbi:MAG: hypothetical protein ACE5JD_01430 [Candidatus Methylomirabilia bacterium]